MPDTQRVQDNERIERSDYEYGIDEMPQSFGRMLPAQFLSNPAGARLWIISGWDITNPALAQCRVTKGVALLNVREKGQVLPGMLSFEGDSQRTLDLASYANGTYGVYVRFELIDAAFQNRIFWNPTTQTEFTQSIATRRIANWGMRVEAVSPGAEWFKIADVAVSGGLITSITKRRQFFFEGQEDASYAATVSDGFTGANVADPTARRVWGAADARGALDRNADRATYGVKDLQTFTAAVREQLRAMQGSNPATPWYGSVVEGLNRKVSRFGDSTLAGDYLPDVHNTRALGSSGIRWNGFFQTATVAAMQAVDASVSGSFTVPGTVDSNIVPGFDDGWQLGSPSFKWSDIYTNFLHAGQIRRQPAITTADIGTSLARFRKLWFEEADFSANLSAFGPISFGSTLTTDGNIHTSGATRNLGQITSAGTRWNVFANDLDVLGPVTVKNSVITDGTTRPIGTNVSATTRFNVFANNLDVLGTLIPRDGRSLEHPASAFELMKLVDNHKIVARGRVLAGVLASGPDVNFNADSISDAGGGSVAINFDIQVDPPYTVLVAGAGSMTGRFVRVSGTPVVTGFAVACEDHTGANVDLNSLGGFFFLVVGRSNTTPA